MELGGELVPGASAVAGLHDMGNLGKEEFLAVQIRVHPLDGKVFGVAQLAQQPAEGTLDEEPGTGLLIQRLRDQHIEDRRQMIVDLCRRFQRETVQIGLVEIGGGLLGSGEKIQDQIFGEICLAGFRVFVALFGILRHQIPEIVILKTEKDYLEFPGKLFRVIDIFVHDTALAGFVGKDLIFHIVGHGAGNHIHDLHKRVFVKRAFLHDFVILFREEEGLVVVGRKTKNTVQSVALSAGLQHDHVGAGNIVEKRIAVFDITNDKGIVVFPGKWRSLAQVSDSFLVEFRHKIFVPRLISVLEY